jgi:ribonuclease P protein component
MIENSRQNKQKTVLQYGKATFTSSEMLRLKSEFNFVRKNGTKYVGKYFLLVYAKASDSKLRIGIICGHKFSKKAVLRNRARRLIKESFRLIKAQIAAGHIIFIPRKRIMNKHLQDVQTEMIKLLIKAGIWIEPIKKEDSE